MKMKEKIEVSYERDKRTVKLLLDAINDSVIGLAKAKRAEKDTAAALEDLAESVDILRLWHQYGPLKPQEAYDIGTIEGWLEVSEERPHE